ncbi:translation elongation factor Ts [Thiohalobacter thiocyanaticus]|uniref:Elongation factor Ts n=1 Tax=Thiohalobacter thiocyanaticus TaxID=585455 RepID=A0A426QE60_9GAMM|nr:translation elongation factor Ts [Thiohalobacter thiocyanaticus]RRQ20055.1 elongation factor Ts [Thiohalobacter thiocyanaticus]
MAITAAQVKELRERTGSGMMECKKALTEAGGDMDAAIEVLRKSGLAKADKKAGRVAAEGLIVIESSEDGKQAVLVEVNSETDFVAKKDEFREFAEQVARRVLASQPADLDALLAMPLQDGGEQSIEEARKELVAKLGENINVRRFVSVSTDGYLGAYLHGTRIGVLVELADANPDLARDLAMHVAASRPAAVDENDVPAEMLTKEREIIEAQAAESGKPAEIVEKMVQGRINKYLKEITLLGQPFVKDPDTSVGKLLEQAGTRVLGFNRMELGEGIEKKQENFADEVMAQVRGE